MILILILSLALSFLLTSGLVWLLCPRRRNNRHSHYRVFVETGAFSLAYSLASALYLLKFERMMKL